MVKITGVSGRLRRTVTPMVAAVSMGLLSVAALAQDADEKPVPMDPATKSLQLWVFGAIAAVVILGGVWYGLRVIQIKRSGNTTDAQANWQD